MEDIEKNEEQPQDVQPLQEENTVGSSQNDIQGERQADEAERGVPVGKFKSVEDLLNAYNSLEAEFTKKSQRLAQIEKEKALLQEQPLQESEARMMLEKIKENPQPNVQNLILEDDQIKEMVIKNYMKQLQDNKAPVIMSSKVGERVTKPVTQKPNTFEAAKKIVLDLLS